MENLESSIETQTNTGGNGHILTIIDSDSVRTEYDLASFGKERVTFGRDQSCDIVISSPVVSRKHGWFELYENGCGITDNGSTNGTYVNGSAIDRAELEDGAAIRIDDLESPCIHGIMMIYSTDDDSAGWIEYPIDEDELTIGRSGDCDIVIDHVTVSLVHARIKRSGDGYIIVPEGNAKNSGVTINGCVISGKTRIAERDVICIANTKLMYSQNTLTYKTEKHGLELSAINIARRVLVKGRKRCILDDTTLKIEPCEFVAIIGGSGSGKSTLMNCINGFDKPTVGKVLVNGVDLYDNYEALKNVIGYVPQQDIVHENLTLFEMLKYVAKLRMPIDTTEEEYEHRVEQVIEMVELKEHRDKIIRTMSGGQKKRASIAVELIDDPSLFFLDEPSSGLDPGTERSLMKLLQRMSHQGKTIIAITHNTQNLHLCDKIIFLGAGGYMAYFGPPAGALEFFGVSDLVDAYTLVESDPQGWEIRFNNSKHNVSQEDHDVEQPPRQETSSKKPFWRQTKVLAQRYMNLIWNDKPRLLFLLLQGPLIALLFSMVSVSDTFNSYYDAQSMLFSLSCAAIWVGLMNAIQEICKERNIVRREYMSDMRLDAYICSKLIVLSAMAFAQSLAMLSVFASTVGLPESGAIGGLPFIEMLITIFLVTISSSSLGLLISALSKNPDRAMVLAPVLLIPQLLFSGILFYLDGVTEVISWVCSSRWSMEALGTIANLNNVMRDSLSQVYKGKQLDNMITMNYNKLYEFSGWHLLLTWTILILTIIGFSFLSAIMLRRIKHDKR